MKAVLLYLFRLAVRTAVCSRSRKNGCLSGSRENGCLLRWAEWTAVRREPGSGWYPGVVETAAESGGCPKVPLRSRGNGCLFQEP